MAERDDDTKEPEDASEGASEEASEEANEDANEDASEDKKSAAPAPASGGLFDSPWTYLLAVPVLVVLWLVFAQSRKNAERPDIDPDVATVSQHPLADGDAPTMAAALAAAWAGEAVDRKTLPARLLEPGQPVYVALRDDGQRLAHLWREADDVAQGGTMWDVLLQALEDARRSLDAGEEERVNRIEINLTHSYRKHDHRNREQRKMLLDIDINRVPHHLGIRGLEIVNGDETKRYAPTLMLARNRRADKQIEIALKDWGLYEREWDPGKLARKPDALGADKFANLVFSTFEADQVLVRLDKSPAEAVVMLRGNRVVDISEVTQASTEALAQGMANWLINNTASNGRLTYQYFPSTGREDKGNNMIRQWMATNAMVRWAADRKDQEVFDLVERNIDYNLSKFFHYERDRKTVTIATGDVPGEDVLGVIEYRGKTKLGGTALAGMAMWLHPKRDKWIHEINALRRRVDHLWHEEDGSFTSFY